MATYALSRLARLPAPYENATTVLCACSCDVVLTLNLLLLVLRDSRKRTVVMAEEFAIGLWLTHVRRNVDQEQKSVVGPMRE